MRSTTPSSSIDSCATRAIENWLKLSLNDLGYRFYMTAEQRQPVIRRLKLMIVPPP